MSTRLPGKVLADIGGKPMLSRVLRRTSRATAISEVIVATTDDGTETNIIDLCEREGFSFVRGHATDVLARYLVAARACGAETVVRITADCPFMDMDVIDHTVNEFHNADPPVDYASNRLVKTFPVGMDVEVIALEALERAGRDADQPYQREHVTPFFYEEPERFRILSVVSGGDFGAMRWTVDTEEDLVFIREIYQRFDNRDDFGWKDVLAVLNEEPELAAINAHIKQRTFRETS